MAHTPKSSMTLASHFDEVKRVESFVDDLQSWAKFSDELYSQVLLVLSEAVTNAIVHGNKEDPFKKVFLNAHLENNSLIITIEDEGEGFDPSNLPDPLKKENLLKESGRGVFLMEQFAETIKYSKNGTKLTICFALG